MKPAEVEVLQGMTVSVTNAYVRKICKLTWVKITNIIFVQILRTHKCVHPQIRSNLITCKPILWMRSLKPGKIVIIYTLLIKFSWKVLLKTLLCMQTSKTSRNIHLALLKKNLKWVCTNRLIRTSHVSRPRGVLKHCQLRTNPQI